MEEKQGGWGSREWGNKKPKRTRKTHSSFMEGFNDTGSSTSNLRCLNCGHTRKLGICKTRGCRGDRFWQPAGYYFKCTRCDAPRLDWTCNECGQLNPLPDTITGWSFYSYYFAILLWSPVILIVGIILYFAFN